MRQLGLALLSSLFIFTSAMAADEKYDLTHRFGVGGGLGVTSPVGRSHSGFDGNFTGGLWARYHLDPRLGLELAYTRMTFDFKGLNLNDLDPTADVVDLSIAYRAWPKEQWHMLVQLGMGYVRFSDISQSRPTKNFDDLALKARLGAEYMLSPNIMLAIHADYFRLSVGGNNNRVETLNPNLALTYYFGGGSGEPKKEDPPKTLQGKVDTDGDSVSDDIDKCPASPANQPVNEFGCAKTEKLEFTLNIQFANGSSKIDEAFSPDLQKLADFLIKYPSVKAEIEGHTDNTGSEKFNYAISTKRAESVRKYMIEKFKIDQARLTSKGFGPSQPVGDNGTPEGRSKNRRVVAHVQAEGKR